MKVGMLTSGGDCQGLNAALRATAKTLYQQVSDIELYGIVDGYLGLMEGNWKPMTPDMFSGILRQGGTILGTSRQPFKSMQSLDPDGKDNITRMMDHYREAGFDCLVILGGNGTHKTAHLLQQSGANVVTLPKTIDNDIYGTDMTFGFDSAVEKATLVIDAIHTTAASHSRIFVVELMGHKAGWLALYAGIAGGADVILLPEFPFNPQAVAEVVEQKTCEGKHFSIIAVAEGALSAKEAAAPKKQRKLWTESAGNRLAKQLQEHLQQDVRVAVPGHYQRGGEPTPADRILCTRFGVRAGMLVAGRQYGFMTALQGNSIVDLPLEATAGKLKTVPQDNPLVQQALAMGISFGIE